MRSLLKNHVLYFAIAFSLRNSEGSNTLEHADKSATETGKHDFVKRMQGKQRKSIASMMCSGEFR